MLETWSIDTTYLPAKLTKFVMDTTRLLPPPHQIRHRRQTRHHHHPTRRLPLLLLSHLKSNKSNRKTKINVIRGV